MTAMLQLDGVTKVYSGGLLRRRNDFVAVDGVSLDVCEGDTIGLVGESGCGKTTTAWMVAGLTRPSSGSVVLDGTNLSSRNRSRATRRQIQMVFQDPRSSLNPRMRIGTLLGEALRVHRIVPRDRIRHRVAELLETVGLPERVVRAFPGELSGGQRQRASIARALAVEPRVLIADEAVSALDVSVQVTIMNLLRDLNERNGLTIIFISHDLAVVRQVCDRVAVMNAGHLVETGVTQEVFSSPQDPYTRRLIDSIPRF